jgi:hypothetical protein
MFRGKVAVAGVLMLPVLADGVGDFDEPGTVFRRFQNVGSRKILGAVLRGIAERLEQPGGNQRGNVMWLTVQHPARLFRREAGGQLAEQRQEPCLFFFHTLQVVNIQDLRTDFFQKFADV